MHSQTKEQDFQEVENSSPEPLREGNLSNLCEGRGETREIEEPRSPLGVIQPLNNPDKGSAAKIIYSKAEEPESPQILGTPIIPNQGSIIKAIPIKAISPQQPKNIVLDIPEGYWHIFDQMAQNQPNTQISTLQYPIVDTTTNVPMKAITL